jgi:hypothetical protein
VFRILFAIAAAFGLAVATIDYSTAYLNSIVTERLFVTPPAGYFERFFPHLDPTKFYLRLNKALYGLKQSAFLWFVTLSSALTTHGFQRTLDACTFYRVSGNDISIVAWHVDDVAMICTPAILHSESKLIASLFKSSPPKVNPATFLHWSVNYSADGAIKLSSRDYLKRLAAAAQGEHISESCSPFAHSLHPRTTSEPCDRATYQRVVGQLTYVAYCSRPDISYHASALGAHAVNPSIDHLAAANKTLRYILSTPDIGITYRPSTTALDALLSAYSDSDWAADPVTRRSQSGVAIYLCNGLVDWSSRRQPTVATSTQEAEITAAVAAISSGIYYSDFLGSLLMPQGPVPLFIDNTSCIDASTTLAQPHAKHVALRLQFIRDYTSNNTIRIKYVPTRLQRADILTKPIAGVKFQHERELIGLS